MSTLLQSLLLSSNRHFFVRAVSLWLSTLLQRMLCPPIFTSLSGLSQYRGQRLLCPSNAVNIVVKAAVSANRHSLSGHSQYHCQHRYKGCCLPIVFTVNIVAKAAVRQLFSLSILLQRLLSANCYHCQYCCKDCCPPIVTTVKIVAKTAAANWYHINIVAKTAVRQLLSLSKLLQRLRPPIGITVNIVAKAAVCLHHFFVYVCFHIEGGWTGSQGLVYIHT